MGLESKERIFSERLCSLLGRYGSARMEYITAEFQPFSHQQRPDVVFVPRSGGYAGQVIFIEIRLSSERLLRGPGYQVLAEHREFAVEALDTRITRFIYATRQGIPELSKKILHRRGVDVLDSISNEIDVVAGLAALGIVPEKDSNENGTETSWNN
jgi:hypothetical protein